uniref:Uncharacterized protein n=1 Tax=Oryza meridionalis TaxID=40149 RepID=A0A0E0DQM1_9ORYZ
MFMFIGTDRVFDVYPNFTPQELGVPVSRELRLPWQIGVLKINIMQAEWRMLLEEEEWFLSGGAAMRYQVSYMTLGLSQPWYSSSRI